jgi:hypothetical protein
MTVSGLSSPMIVSDLRSAACASLVSCRSKRWRHCIRRTCMTCGAIGLKNARTRVHPEASRREVGRGDLTFSLSSTRSSGESPLVFASGATCGWV